MKKAGDKKTQGRKKGVPNKLTAELRELLKQFVEDNFSEAQKLWQRIPEGDKKLRLYLDIMSYVIPKPSSDFTDEERKVILELLKQGSNEDNKHRIEKVA